MPDSKTMLFICYLYTEDVGGVFQHSTRFQVLATSEAEAEKIARSYQPEKQCFHLAEVIDPEILKK